MYFYSQRHIVGVDFKQPAIVNGLLLLGPQNTRTQAAQAMYRLRKLGRGHTIDVGACFDAPFVQGRIAEMLQHREEVEEGNKHVSLRLQYAKYVQRKEALVYNNAYAETHNNTDFTRRTPDTSVLLAELVRLLNCPGELSKTSMGVLRPILDSAPSLARAVGVLFNQTVDVAETETAVLAEVAVEAVSDTNANRTAFDVQEAFFTATCALTIWNWAANDLDTVPSLFTIFNGIDVVHFSRNLCATPNCIQPRSYFLVQLSAHRFLLEPVDALPYYLVCGKPLLNMAGHVLNNTFLARTHAEVDVPALFNVRCCLKALLTTA